MLATENIRNDFKQIVDFLQRFEAQTDRRYAPNISNIVGNVSDIDRFVQEEGRLRQELEGARMRGFQVDEYINKEYDNYDNLVKEITAVLTAIQQIQPYINDFTSMQNKINPNTRAQLTQLFRNPKTFDQAKKLLGLVKGQLNKGGI